MRLLASVWGLTCHRICHSIVQTLVRRIRPTVVSRTNNALEIRYIDCEIGVEYNREKQQQIVLPVMGQHDSLATTDSVGKSPNDARSTKID
jgi:hypothetical protein